MRLLIFSRRHCPQTDHQQSEITDAAQITMLFALHARRAPYASSLYFHAIFTFHQVLIGAVAGDVDRLHKGDVERFIGTVDSHGELTWGTLDADARREPAGGTKGERLYLVL